MRVPMVDGDVEFTSGFRTANRPTHHGVDFAARPRGGRPPVLSFDEGEVIFVGRNSPTAGNWIDISHGKLFTTYIHLDSIADGIRVGSRVMRSQQIGILGNTGAERTSQG